MRTFIAIPFQKNTLDRLALIQKNLQSGIREGVSWVNPMSVHLTLKFLGEVDEPTIIKINQELEEVGRSTTEFNVTCGGIGCFPNDRHPKVIWFGVLADSQLWELQKQVENFCFDLGFPREERKFSPHLTLGRVKNELGSPVLNHLLSEIGKEDNQFTETVVVNEVIL
ncbi:MAG TPA: RNA 2',3'-cyclic phosphodiesterase, partial [Leptolinea sp.]